MSTRSINGELSRLCQKHGRLSADIIVKFATANPKSAIYASFQSRGLWDDEVAAGYGRRIHAEYLLRKYVVTVTEVGRKPIILRGVVSLPSDRQDDTTVGSYRPILEVLQNGPARKELLHMALSDLRAFETKYRMLASLVARPLKMTIDAITVALRVAENEEARQPR